MSGQGPPLETPGDEGSGPEAFIEDPDMRRLFDYWRDQRRGRALPSLSDIDPLDIPWALSRIYLVDHNPESEFVYRLAGNEIAGVFGRTNLKGLRPRDFLPAARAVPVEAMFKRVVDERCIMWMKGLIYLRADRTPIGERLFLPLGDTEGSRISGVLGMTVIHSTVLGSSTDLDYARERFIAVDDLP